MTHVFPLGTAFLPGDDVVLRVFEDRYVRMFGDILESGTTRFATVLIERGSEVGGGDKRFGHGVMVKIDSVATSADGLVVSGAAGATVRIVSWSADDPWPAAEVQVASWEPMKATAAVDCASAITLLAQSVRSLLERHTDGATTRPHPLGSRLAGVASGRWFGTDVPLADLERAFWVVARCVPCGPLDRHGFLVPTEGAAAVRLLRTVIEHTDEILAFGLRDRR